MLRSTEKKEETNFIAAGSKLVGDLVSSGDIRIDGQLNGSIKTHGRLVVGEAGIIDGQISCKSAIVGGQIKAKITTKDLLTLRSSAKLSGEIVAGQLSIEPGAIFSGKCSMGPIVKKISKTDTSNLDQSKAKIA